jgi:beta-lactamase superfamily II metal-dependent hydrolase
MLSIEMLNAGHGDALFIEYGDRHEVRRIIVDGGPHHAYVHPGGLLERLSGLPPDERHFELLVMTHIDTDHIDGIIRLLQEDPLGLTFGDIWFNGWKHVNLAVEGKLGGKQGEFLGALLEHRGLPWNENPAFASTLGAIVVPNEGDLPVANLGGGATATLLSPGHAQLRALEKGWVAALRSAGFDAGDTSSALEKLEQRRTLRPLAVEGQLVEGQLGESPDNRPANGSSIAFVFEYGGNRLLLTGDAFAPVLEEAGRRYEEQFGKLSVDAFKLPHHGSFSNLTAELLELVETDTYLISSNGKYYGHPDENAMELILMRGSDAPQLVFNYEQEHTRSWLARDEQAARGFTAERANRVVIAD